jgi:hypothetical protein
MCRCDSNCEEKCSKAECQCSPCRYRNGIIPLLVAQVLIILAFLVSLFATLDCHFVTVDASLVSGNLDAIERLSEKFDVNIVPSNSTTRGLGFYFWEGIDGECTSQSTDYTDNMYDMYRDVLGSDWNAPRGMANVTTFFAFLLLIWIFLFSCVAQPSEIRYGLAFTFLVIMTIFSSIPFMILNSDFCNDNACSVGRSAKYAAVATSLYAVIGLTFIFTQKYPKPKPQHPVGFFQKDLEEQRVSTSAKDNFGLDAPGDATLQEVSLANEYPDSVKKSID